METNQKKALKTVFVQDIVFLSDTSYKFLWNISDVNILR